MEKYYKYKHIFSGAHNPQDVDFLRKKCPECDYPIIDSIIRTQNYMMSINSTPQNNDIGNCNGDNNYYNDMCKRQNISNELQLELLITPNHDSTRTSNLYKISCIQMNEIIKILSELKYREDCEKYLNTIPSYKKDTAQTNIFSKILSTKPHDDSFIDLPQVEKACPHCGKINSAPLGTTYIVCGVDTCGLLPINNYDDNCLNDWCFMCGKKLCKNWNSDNLFVKANRIHNGECCKKHAELKGFNYPADYCQCYINGMSEL